MGGHLEVHPSSLRQAGKGLHDVAGRLRQAWQDLENTARGMGGIFGDDMVSSLISASYQAAHGMAQESYTSAADGLEGFADGLAAMAEVYDKVEQATTDASATVAKAV